MKQLLLFFLVCCISTSLQAQTTGVQFNGTTGGISFCHDDALNITEGFTIEAWIFSPEWKSEFWQGSIVNKDQQGPDVGYALRAGKNGILNLVMSVDDVWFETSTDPIMNTNQWYHVAAVVDDGAVRLYINGNQQAMRTFSGTPSNGSSNLTVGESAGFPGRVWNGILDEIRVWNIARTAAEIADNQTTEFTGSEAGLVLYAPLEEGAGLTTANLGTISCNGTFVDLAATAWTDGYSIPPVDVGVSAVIAPDVLSIYSRPVKTQVTINNYGSEAVTDVPVALSVNSIPTLMATYPGTIEPGTSVNFIFEEPLDLTGNNTNLLTATTTLGTDPNGLNNSTTYRYRKPADGANGPLVGIRTREQHNFGAAGQNRTSTINLPENMEDYEQLLLHLSVECPGTGCDPWDQTGNITILTENGPFEIARFITPYRIACGGPEWVVDVTDFKDMLAGTVTIGSFIQVFGQSGWLLNANLELVKGNSPVYQKTSPLWSTQYHVYGDPGIEDDLPELTRSIEAQTTDSHFRLTMSGHGQGNTNNAAEFSNQTHRLMLEGELATVHNLWKGDCLQNECANQFGSWEFNRAGWCPGQAVQPFIFDLGGDLFAGTDITLDYELQPYTNLLNTNYDDMGHTEPFYRIAAYIVEESEMHYTSLTNLRADSMQIFVAGDPNAPTEDRLVLYLKNTGAEDVVGGDVAFFVDGDLVAEETFSETILAGDTMAYTFRAATGIADFEDVEVIARVTIEGDENVSDDATNAASTFYTVGASNVSEAGVAVYPNPTNGQLNLSLTPAFIGGQLEVIDVNGRVLQSLRMQSLNLAIDIPQKGLAVLRFRTNEGLEYYQKVVVN
ncbi:MAG: LamG-like jellyroll fold domain-containing protein [Lewinella sp.]